MAWATYLAARAVVRVKYLGMPNLLAEKEVVSEFIQHRAEPHRIADEMRILVDDSIAREEMISAFDTIIGQVGEGKASETAARAILEELNQGRSPGRPGGLESAAPWRMT